VAKVLRQLGKAANGLANQRHQSLQITSSSPLWAAVDTMGLQRACSHLLDNALHHTPPGGYVRTNAIRAPGGGVLIIIEDNGPHVAMKVGGVAPLAAESRDVDLKNGLDRDEMKFVRDIVELQLGGVLRVQSPHLLNAPCGVGGTRVEIWLPAATDIQLPTA
jgi:signal transduction histidine kinase